MFVTEESHILGVRFEVNEKCNWNTLDGVNFVSAFVLENRKPINVWRPSDKQKEHRSTKEKIERPTRIEMEQARNCLYSLAVNDGDKL